MSTPLPPDDDDATEDDEKPTLVERLRGTGVGVEDPNIVGEPGPTGVPPGVDADDAVGQDEGIDPAEGAGDPYS